MATKTPNSPSASPSPTKNPARSGATRGSSARSTSARGSAVGRPSESVSETPAIDGNDIQRMNTKTTKTNRQNHSSTDQQRADLDIEYFRGLLLSERARLEEERDARRKNNIDMDTALPEEGEGGDEDTADLASAMMDKEYELSVEDEIDSMLQSVDHALQKMDDGTYGICDMSGEPIPVGRLELIPWASLTVECQALAEGE